MGYRSQVGGVISVDGWILDNKANEESGRITKYKEMIGFIKLSKFYEAWNTTDADKECFGWRNGEFYFYGDSFKWYSEYEDVKAWYQLWEDMQDIEGISGYFCRVGEEMNDVETEEFGDEPDYEAFQSHQYLDCNVDKSVFGGGDIDKEINLTMLDELKGNELCMDSTATQA